MLALVVAAALALAPGAALARPAHQCANKKLKSKVGGRTYTVVLKEISTEGGVSCAKAYKLIRQVTGGHIPNGWKAQVGRFTVPEGMVPEVLAKGHQKVKYAIPGG